MNKKNREVIIEKIITLLILSVIFSILYFVKYDFSNYLLNGLMLLVCSFLSMNVLMIKKFYIETGKNNYEDPDFYELYTYKYPWIALYNKVLSFIFVIFVFISLYMIGKWVYTTYIK